MGHKICLCVLVLLGAVAASADVVAWYRFDELDPGVTASTTCRTLTNSVAPGTFDLTMRSFSGTTLGDDANLLPVGTNAFGSKLMVYDPLTGNYHTNNRAMHFGARGALGTATTAPGSAARVLTKYDDAIGRITNVTVEAIFRLKEDATANYTFPLVQRYGFDDYQPDWGLTVNQNGLWQRYRCVETNVASTVQNFYGGGAVSRGVWHHAAFTFDSTASNVEVRLYLDYSQVAIKRHVAGSLLQRYTVDKYLDIGFRPGVNNSTFVGEIDEIRICDKALAPKDFLRIKPVVEDLDPDTVFYHPLDFDTGVVPAIAFDINAATNAGALVGTFYYEGSAISKSRPSGAVGVVPGTDGVLRQGALARDQANGGSIYCQTNEPNKGTSIRVATPDRALYRHSFTAEMFFKADKSRILSSGSAITLLYGQSKTLVAGDGKSSSCRAYDKAYGYDVKTSQIYSGNLNLWDEQWHHVAFVYDYEGSNVLYYIDHVLLGTTLANSDAKKPIRLFEGSDGHTTFFFGMQYDDDRQFFPGWIDSPRIVRRALKPHEFLSRERRCVRPNTLVHMTYDGDFSAGPYPSMMRLAATTARSGGNKPTIDNARRFAEVYLDGEAMEEPRLDAGSVLMNGSLIRYAPCSLLEQREFTLEFFAKFDTLPEGNASILRLNRSVTSGEANSTWSPAVYKSGAMRFHHYLLKADGTFNDQSPTFASFVPQDRRWHHYAITASYADGNTTLTAYRDYLRVGESLVAEGAFYYPPDGTCLSLGAGGDAANSNFRGWINEVRISQGALPVSAFMRKAGTGMTILVR